MSGQLLFLPIPFNISDVVGLLIPSGNNCGVEYNHLKAPLEKRLNPDKQSVAF